jgi:hypothetical protein
MYIKEPTPKTTSLTSSNLKSRESFRDAILALLKASPHAWPQPVIYAVTADGGAYRFDVCNAPAMPKDAIPWIYPEPGSFGSTGMDLAGEADFITDTMFEAAINAVSDSDFLSS